jgi:hypothetical protein
MAITKAIVVITTNAGEDVEPLYTAGGNEN